MGKHEVILSTVKTQNCKFKKWEGDTPNEGGLFKRGLSGIWKGRKRDTQYLIAKTGVGVIKA